VYNLLDESWIGVTTLQGEQRQLSLADVITQAGQLSGLSVDLPTQRFALTRLLLAFLHRALDGPEHESKWRELWDSPGLLNDPVREYAERVRPRFNLFDSDAPFYQVADLRTAKGEFSTLGKLVADVPDGQPLFTTRSALDLRRISCDEAARWLVHAQAFDPSGIKSGAVGDPTVKGGRGYPIGVGWCGQLGGLLAEGATLHETLLLNLIPSVSGEFLDDVPAWERPPLTACRRADAPTGPLDVLTWQSRRIRLIGDADGVEGVVLCNGDPLTPQNRHLIEHFTAWRYSAPQTKKHGEIVFMPQTHDPDRQVWRGLSRLLPRQFGRTAGERNEPVPPLSRVVDWLSRLVEHGVLPHGYFVRLSAIGMVYGSNNSVIDEVVDDGLACPAPLFDPNRENLSAFAVSAVAAADSGAQALAHLADDLAVAAGGDRGTRSSEARARAFAELDAPVRRLLAEFPSDPDLAAVRRRWHQQCYQILRTLGDVLLTSAGPAAWRGDLGANSRGIDAARADARFRAALSRALPRAHADHPVGQSTDPIPQEQT